MSKRHGARRPGGSAAVNLHVRDLAQLFSSFDPSPFWDRDLDRDAANFIEEEFSDLVPAGSVTRSDPAIGQRAGNGTTVTIRVSKGPAFSG